VSCFPNFIWVIFTKVHDPTPLGRFSNHTTDFNCFHFVQEAAASSLVMKLQLMIAKLNSALEDQCAAVVQSVPRVIGKRGAAGAGGRVAEG
jgi:hypothetical protein